MSIPRIIVRGRAAKRKMSEGVDLEKGRKGMVPGELKRKVEN